MQLRLRSRIDICGAWQWWEGSRRRVCCILLYLWVINEPLLDNIWQFSDIIISYIFLEDWLEVNTRDVMPCRFTGGCIKVLALTTTIRRFLAVATWTTTITTRFPIAIALVLLVSPPSYSLVWIFGRDIMFLMGACELYFWMDLVMALW